MKAAMMRVLAVIVLWLLAAPARADLPPSEQRVCRGKRPGDLCAMPDGAGGVCTVGPCDAKDPRDAQACLACAKAPVNTPGSGFPVGFLIVGAVVTLTAATVVILRLRRHWGDKP